MATRRSSTSSSVSSSPALFEQVEPRRLMSFSGYSGWSQYAAPSVTLDSSGTLNITGTGLNDDVQLRINHSDKAHDTLWVTVNGSVSSFPTASISRVVASLGDGDDTFVDQSTPYFPLTIYGGRGNDAIYGSRLADYIYGGEGNDTLHGWVGDDMIWGEGGSDYLAGDEGFDTIRYDEASRSGGVYVALPGRANTNNSTGNGAYAENDTIVYQSGDLGIEAVVGTNFGDTLIGGEKNESLNGLGGGDVIYGGAGHDTLDGGAGADQLFGEAGNDWLLARDGWNHDYCDGGADYDWANVDFSPWVNAWGSYYDRIVGVEYAW